MREKKKPINQQCREIYKYIEFCRKEFGWNLREMCSQCYDIEQKEKKAEYIVKSDEEKKEKEAFYQRYKKSFNIKRWDRGNANSTTLASLEKLRGLICRTKEHSRIPERMVLEPEEIEKIREASRKLENELLLQHDAGNKACE